MGKIKSSFRKIAASFALAAITAGPAVSIADDLQIFMQPPSATLPAPNIFMIMENGANWGRNFSAGWGTTSKQGEAELTVVRDTLNGLTNKNVKIGIFEFVDDNSNGGTFPRYGTRLMSEAANLTALTTMINGMLPNVNDPAEKSNQASVHYAGGFREIYNYLAGAARTSAAGALRDYASTDSTEIAANAARAIAGNAFASSTATAYTSPLSTTDYCAKNYAIVIANNASSYKPSNNSGAYGLNSGSVVGSSASDLVNIPSGGSATDYSDEWARFLFNIGAPGPTVTITNPDGSTTSSTANGKVVTYAIDVYDGASPDNAAQTTMLKSMARAGGGKYFSAQNQAQFQAALAQIFNEIQSVNTVFASVALPVSVNVRGSNLNQVYLGVFRPDGDGNPNWAGNLKEYKLNYDSSTKALVLVDAAGTTALNPNTGFMASNVRSFGSKANSYWSFAPSSDVNSPSSDGPDGPMVERGGAAQNLRLGTDGSSLLDPDSRTVYTVTSGQSANSALTALFNNANTSDVTSAALGASSSAERTEIIDYVRGKDIDDENGNGNPISGSLPDYRPKAHGDVIHSRPVVVNYNRAGATDPDVDNDVVVFYGANDGLLHAIKGGQNETDGSAYQAMREIWSFAAPEFFSKLRRIRNNNPPLNLVASGGGSSSTDASARVFGNVSLIDGSYGVANATTVTGGSYPTSPVTTVSSSNVYPVVTLAANAGAGGSPTATFSKQFYSGANVSYSTVAPYSISWSTLNARTGSAGTAPAWMSNVSYPMTGASIAGTGIPAGTTIVSVATETPSAVYSWTLNRNAAATNPAASLSVYPRSAGSLAVWDAGQNVYFDPSVALPAYAVNNAVFYSGLTRLGGSSGKAGAAATTVSQVGFSGATVATSQIITDLAITTPATAVTGESHSCTYASGSTTLYCTQGTAPGAFTLPFSGTASVTAATGNKIPVPNAVTAMVSSSNASCPSSPCVQVTITTPSTAAKTGSSTTFSRTPAPTTVSGISAVCFAGKTSLYPLSAVTTTASTYFSAGSCLSATGSSVLTTGAASPVTKKIVLNNNTGASGTGVLDIVSPTAVAASFSGGIVAANASVSFSGTPDFSLLSPGMAVYSPNIGSSPSDLADPTYLVAKYSPAASTVTTVTLSQAPTAAAGAYRVSMAYPAKTLAGFSTVGLTSGFTSAQESILENFKAAVEADAVAAGIDSDVGRTGKVLADLSGTVTLASTLLTSSPGTNATYVNMSGASTVTDGSVNTLTFTTASSSSAAQPKDYFFDGPMGSWQKDGNGDKKFDTSVSGNNDQVWIFPTMRRGGRQIYAFDVTNPTAPLFKWKVGCPNMANNSGCTNSNWNELGQTWSGPFAATMANSSGGSADRPHLIFGAGYDGAEDNTPVSATRTMGRGIYVIDAANGNIQRAFVKDPNACTAGTVRISGSMTYVCDMNYPIPADGAVVVKDHSTGVNGNVHRAYFTDTGAQVWRIDVSNVSPAKWIITKLASLGAAADATQSGVAAAARKFLFAPDVIYGGKDSRGHFDYVLVGSGDREDPFDTTITNRFYMIKDYDVEQDYQNADSDTSQADSDLLVTSDITSARDASRSDDKFPVGFPLTTNAFPVKESHLYDATADLVQICADGMSSADCLAQKAAALTGMDGKHGWYITMEAGEKAVSGATSLAGYVSFGTNKPIDSSQVCGVNLGEARLYTVNVKTAGAFQSDLSVPITSTTRRYTVIVGGGLPPTPVPVAVIEDGERKEGLLSGTEVKTPEATVSGDRIRTYFKKKVDRVH